MPGIAKAGKPIKWNQQNASTNEGRGKKTKNQNLKKEHSFEGNYSLERIIL